MGAVRARARRRAKARIKGRDEERAPLARSPLAPRAAHALELQRAVGNQAVGLIVKQHGKEGPHKPPVEDSEEDVKKLPKNGDGGVTTAPESVQRNGDPPETAPAPAPTPARPEYHAGAVTPTFLLATPAPKRSNSDSSTTLPATPTFTGHTAFDSGAKKWRYQVDGIESKGTIQIVYYTEDHYPAPTPTDDKGALSNVTSGNWKAIVKDLKDNRTGIAAKWSAYQAEDLHENYHWVNEWQATVKPKFAEAQTAIAALEETEASSATQGAANTVLEAKATTIFTTKIREARTTFNALGDSPGDPPYIAQAPAVDALVKRVEDHATAQKWS